LSNCNEIAPLLGAFEDGELEPHELQEVARHVATCHDCDAALDELAAIGRRIRDAVAIPQLDGFAEAVQKRIAEIRVPFRQRIRERLDGVNQRWIAGMTLTSAALAVGAWSAILFVPAIHHGGLIELAASQPRPGQHATEESDFEPVTSPEAATTETGGQPILISRLESEMPSVAVWNQPDAKTTVIWLPDDAAGND
jgi:anti-sigma factor RsiW